MSVKTFLVLILILFNHISNSLSGTEDYYDTCTEDLFYTGTKGHFDTGPTEEYLVNTANCKIPTYDINYNDKTGAINCGKRKIFVRKVEEDQIQFIIKAKLENCCYYYINRSKVPCLRDRAIKQSKCNILVNGTIAELKTELIRVVCVAPFYEDLYALIKKVKTVEKKNPWNVLIIGMDSMSRNRALKGLKSTIQFLRSRRTFEFKGFHKIGHHTYQNIMPFLYNMTLGDINAQCNCDFTSCRNMSLLEKFRRHGYVTAYGMDDAIEGPLQHVKGGLGYALPPADHYLDTLFLAGEQTYKRNKTLICTKKLSSGEHTLNYALDFAKTYKNDNFFGFFFIATFSHDITQSPKLIDKKLRHFYEELENNGILKNTFIILFSDHGVSYGPLKLLKNSLYDSSMPMLFLRPPSEYECKNELNNLRQNQVELTNNFDLHLTLMDILTEFNSTAKLKHAACPMCRSLLAPVLHDRTCEAAGINAKICACDLFEKLHPKGNLYDQISRETTKAIAQMNNISSKYDTFPCTYCKKMALKKTARLHRYYYGKEVYFVSAVILKPADLAYEFWMKLNNSRRIYLVDDEILPISKLYDVNYCAPTSLYCVCGVKKSC